MKIKLLALLPLLLVGCKQQEYKKPFEWCYIEVCTNYDNYLEEDFYLPYSYKEIYDNDNLDSEWYIQRNIKVVYCYEITTYDLEKADVWFCGIAYSTKKQNYSSKDCIDIDCDYLYSISYQN